MNPFLNDYIYKYIYPRVPILHTPLERGKYAGVAAFRPVLGPGDVAS